MNDAIDTGRLRELAQEAIDPSYEASPMLLVLASGLLALLDQRDTGRRLAEDRFDAEMAELRDEIHTVAMRVAQMATGRDVGVSLGMLSARVDGLAGRVESHGELLEQHSYTLRTHSMRLSGLGGPAHA